MPLETDLQEFLQAAAPLKEKVWVSRDTHVACRKFLVACQIIKPGGDADRHQYGVALLELLRTKQLPVAPPPSGPTPEEAAADQARRNKGVLFRDDEADAPARALDDSVFQDPRLLHNSRVDAEMQRRSDLAARGSLRVPGVPELIPGLKDEHEQVFVGGRVARYATSQLQEKNRAHNTTVRREWAAKQAAAAQSKPRGL